MVVKTKDRPEAGALRDMVVAELDDAKGEEIVVIDLAGKSDIADFMVIASGRTGRQLSAMSDRLLRRFKDAGMGSVPVEGARGGQWVLIDGGDVIVHLFRPEIRELYNLEKMWAVALPADGARTVEVSGGDAR